jgi:hypothetical protein
MAPGVGAAAFLPPNGAVEHLHCLFAESLHLLA